LLNIQFFNPFVQAFDRLALEFSSKKPAFFIEVSAFTLLFSELDVPAFGA
jgi:hypothetical protein